MQLSLSFVTGLTVAGAALAAPVPSSPANESFFQVALSKRNVNLHKANSFVIDTSKVAAHVSSIRAKYAQTLSNLESDGIAKREVSKIPLVAQQGGSFWSGTVQFGDQALTVDFDTGSSDVVINEGAYKPSSNSTKTSKTFLNRYGTASSTTEVSGTVYQDSFSSGPIKASKASVGLITSGGEVIDGADGLIGLAYPAISNYGPGLPPLFDALISQNAVSSKTFSFALSTDSSELTLGGIDSSKYSGSITYTPVSRKAYWQVPATVNGQPFSSIVDSGTTLVIADTNTGSAQRFFKQLGVETFQQGGDLYGEVDCDKPPKITFDYGGKKITLSKESAILGKTNTGTCALTIIGTSVGQSAWITGDPVFLNSYVVFDRENDRVGFADRS